MILRYIHILLIANLRPERGTIFVIKFITEIDLPPTEVIIFFKVIIVCKINIQQKVAAFYNKRPP
jgi:hypothetical protein